MAGMEKISILYLIDQMRDMGGAERNLVNILTYIDQSRFQYFLYTFQLESPMKELLETENIPCAQIPYPTSPEGIKKYLALVRKIKQQKINILHSYFESSDIWGTLLAKLAGIPIIVSSKRDLGFLKSKKVLLAYRFINPFITKIIAVSDAVKYQVSIQEKVSLDKIVTIYNGVDIFRFNGDTDQSSLKNELKFHSSWPVVGVIANIKPIKGLEYFIRAAAEIVKQFPHTHFIVVGSSLPTPESQNYYRQLRTLINELNLGKNLFFLGKRADIPEILSMIDISVLPSLSEGFSNTVIESMAAGKPVVVTEVGGNAEAVVHERTGYVVPARDVHKLAEAVCTLLADRNLAHRMGQAGRLRAKQFFSIETMISKIENLYLSLLNSLASPIPG